MNKEIEDPTELTVLWLELDSMERAGLPKSALDIVEKIVNLSAERGLIDHQIKAILYENRFRGELEEDGMEKTISRLTHQAEESDGIKQAILFSYLGELYQNYLNDHRWELQDRSTQMERPDDVRLMSIWDLQELSDNYYRRSLENENLTDVSLDSFKLLLDISGGQMDQQVPLTLFDLLLSRSLDHFMTGNPGSPEAKNIYRLDNPALFSSDFESLNLTFTDSADHRLQAMKLFLQGMLTQGSQRISLSLKRLSYLLRESENPNKDSLYVSALNSIINSDLEDESLARSKYELASYYYQHGNLVKAHSLCVSELKKDQPSKSQLNFQTLRKRIEEQSLNTEVEQVSLLGQALLASIRYKNVRKTYSRIVKLSFDEWSSLNALEQDERLQGLLARTPLEVFSTELHDPSDYMEHGTEVMISPKDLGSYVWLLSDNSRFSAKDGVVVINAFQVSVLSFAEEGTNGAKKIRVFDRQDGKAIKDVQADFYESRYINNKVNKSLFGTGTSDPEGYISIPSGRSRGLSVILSKTTDTLSLDDYNYWSYGNVREHRERVEVRFFLDRSLYRPGQLVHYKCILISRDENQVPSILPNQKVDLVLRDANGQELESQSKVSNLFGSVWGTFVLPVSGRLGSMSIAAKESLQSVRFQVEEYKRPSFQITFDTATNGSLNADFQVQGNVSSFAGAPIGNAKFEYHVVRKSRFSGFRGWWRSPWPSVPDKEIAAGTSETDGSGNFLFPFYASGEINEKFRAYSVYDFLITVQITDASGETQVSNTTVTLGSKNHGVEMVSHDIINISNTKTLKFNVKTPAGVPVAVDASIEVFKMERESGWKRKRYWSYPDQMALDPGVFDSELNWYSSEEANLDDEKSISLGPVATSSNMGVGFDADLSELDLHPGTYKIVVNSSLEGQKQESSFFVRLVKPHEPFVPSDQLMHVIGPPLAASVGDTVGIYAGTATDGLISYVIERSGNVERRVVLDSKAGWYEIMVPIKEADRGGVFVHLQCVFQNRIENKQVKIEVPWSNKELNVQFETIRKVVKPGDKETVSVNISRADDAVGKATEVLVSMYDASLDILFPHKWDTDFFPVKSPIFLENTPGYGMKAGITYFQYESYAGTTIEWFPTLRWFGLASRGRRFYKSASPVRARSQMSNDSEVLSSDMAMSTQEESTGAEQAVDIRKEFGENLLYYPDLQVNEDGNIKFKYMVNDALTTWKMMLFAHDEALATGYRTVEIVSRKELMVTVNKPRFLRAGDEVILRGKIDNLTNQEIQGNAKLSLVNAIDGSPLHFAADFQDIVFTVAGHSSTFAEWKVNIPADFGMPIQFTMLAVGKNHSDGEQGVVPILENRTLVTNTRAIEIGGGAELTFDLQPLFGEESQSVQPQSLTVEITSNPAWYAISSLPYLMDAPFASSEQIFNQFYANAMGLRLVQDYPVIRQLVRDWGGEAPTSPLLENAHLKNSVIEESPWLLDAMNETDQMRRIATYFDSNKMEHDLRTSLTKLQEMQNVDGGFTWFSGGRPNWYITQYILEGLIKMRGWINDDLKTDLNLIIGRGVVYIEQEILRHHQQVMKHPMPKPTTGDHLTPIITYYLYIKALEGSAKTDQEIVDLERFYLTELEMGWKTRSLYEQAMTAQIFTALGMDAEFQAITSSLRERVLNNPELGAYWKYESEAVWWKLPIETQARMIEVFSAIPKDADLVLDLKRWLLNHKRTNSWSNSKATSEAIRALTMGQSSWIKAGKAVLVRDAGRSIPFSRTKSWGNMKNSLIVPANEIKDFGPLKLENPNEYPAWGAMYYQFFQDLDKITRDSSGPMKIDRTLFIPTNSDKGIVLKQIPSSGPKVGDRVLVQLKISADRDMEFVHIKDLRGAALEPIAALSHYVWKGGLGYFQSTTDLATNFFIDYLPRGTYTIEYELLVSQNGDFSAGNCMIQSMYAPEFSAHSHGDRIQVRK